MPFSHEAWMASIDRQNETIQLKEDYKKVGIEIVLNRKKKVMCYRDLRNNGEHLSSNDSDIRRLYRERVEEPKEQKKREQREAGRLERLYWEGVAKEKEQERQKEQERREGEERYRRFCERVEKLEEMKKREENERVRLYREKVEEFKEQEENGVVAEGYGDGDGDSDGDGEETQSAREEGKAVVEDMVEMRAEDGAQEDGAEDDAAQDDAAEDDAAQEDATQDHGSPEDSGQSVDGEWSEIEPEEDWDIVSSGGDGADE